MNLFLENDFVREIHSVSYILIVSTVFAYRVYNLRYGRGVFPYVRLVLRTTPQPYSSSTQSPSYRAHKQVKTIALRPSR